MARELILIPKTKYEQLINNKESEDSSSMKSFEKDTKDSKQTEPTLKSDMKSNISSNENITKKTTETYMKMKPKKFLKNNVPKSKPVEQKWLTFSI